MQPTIIVILSLLARMAGSTESSSHHHRKQKHLNVLMLIIDDLRADYLGAYNERDGAAALTPNLDSLAKQSGSTLFSKAYCQYALCSPSRMSFLTGVRPDTTRVYDLKQRLRTHLPNAISLPQHFHENGYFTKGIGKVWHRGHVDELSWSVEQPWVDRPHYALPRNLDALKLRAQNMHESKNRRLKPQLGPLIEVDDTVGQRDDVYTDGAIAHAAVAALQEAKSHLIASGDEKKKGFFVAVGFMKPHLPWCVPKRYWDAVNVSTVPFLTDTVSSAPSKRSPTRAVPIPGNELATYHFNHKDLKSFTGMQELRRAYAACVHFVDAQVGIVLSALNGLGLQESTAIVFLSDHGYKLGEHGSWTKGTNVEEDTRVPLLFHIPKWYISGHQHSSYQHPLASTEANPSAVLDDSVVELVDLFPTLIDICRLSSLPTGSQTLEGKSLFPSLSRPLELEGRMKRRPQPALSAHEEQIFVGAQKSKVPYAVMHDIDQNCGVAFSQVLSGKFMGYSVRRSCVREASRKSTTEHYRSGHRLTIWIEFATKALSVGSQIQIERARVESLAKSLLPISPDSYTLSSSNFLVSGNLLYFTWSKFERESYMAWRKNE